NLAVGRIHDEPGAAAFAHLVDVAELGRVADLAFRIPAQEFRALERVGLPLLHSVVELLRRHIVETPALEFLRPLEWRAVLVLVGVVALQIWIAPRRLRRLILSLPRRSRRRRRAL